MIRKISIILIFACLLIAIPLALMGYEKVELGGPFLAFMRTTSDDLNNYKITIPDIPKIPAFEEPKGLQVVLNFLVRVVNGLSTLLNVIIMVLNELIQLLEFFFLMIRNLITFKDTIARINTLPSA